MYLIIFTDFFPPGFKAGGPVKSCLNTALGLGEKIKVQVLTRNAEWGSEAPFHNMENGLSLDFDTGVQVTYLTNSERHFTHIIRRISQMQPGVLYLNSMFSVPFTFAPLAAKRLGWTKSKIVLAPRGMLKPSALQFKALKKKIFLTLFKLTGIQHLIEFHATSEAEKKDIQNIFGNKIKIHLNPQAPDVHLLKKRVSKTKNKNFLHLVTIGRIHPIKNIKLGIELLKSLSDTPVQYDIIGPFEDTAYLEVCKRHAEELPSNVNVQFLGEMPPEMITPYIQKSDFFYLLTQGENFGHAIFEALALGKPVIISDQTPWVGLEQKKTGWDIPLNDIHKIKSVLQETIEMDNTTYQEWSEAAFQCAQSYVKDSNWEAQYLRMFFGDDVDFETTSENHNV